MKFEFGPDITTDLRFNTEREWIETNGIGGYSSSSISGMNTRKYHGILVGALHPPVGRTVLLSKWVETILTKEESYELDCNNFGNSIHPEGYRYLEKFEKEFFPVFYYRCGHILLKKTIGMVYGENTTVIQYQVLEADRPFKLKLKPFIAFRDYHHLAKANGFVNTGISFENDVLSVQPYELLPKMFIQVPGAEFHYEPDWYYHFHYDSERERGLEFTEDLFTYGQFYVELKKGDEPGVIVSLDNPSGKKADKLFKLELDRKKSLVKKVVSTHNMAQVLALAADQFVVKRGKDLKTIIAGYHWFSDWGRDTMIALPGLTLVTGRHEDARKILKAFSGHVDQGMIPNRFPDVGEEPEYNTVDASLWYFVATYLYFKYTNDLEFIEKEMYAVLKDIVDWHIKGTRYGIGLDEDGLIKEGEEGVQLTWMDAKVGDWVVTPRIGKPVEINALWYNALMIMQEFAELLKKTGEAKNFKAMAAHTKRSFNLSFTKESGSLYDLIHGDFKDASVRPNQLFAISLPFMVVDKSIAKNILKEVEAELYTPFGLRSLSPRDGCYIGHYEGGQVSRDGAYHQGTSWSWLLGPYFTAKIKVEGERGRKQIKELLYRFLPHLQMAGVGTVSEIFDGNAPFYPKGCVAQAWGVAELLRVICENPDSEN